MIVTAAALLAAALLAWPGARPRVGGPAPASKPEHDPKSSDPLATSATLDLFAACLRSGLGAGAAAAAVADTADGPVANTLRRAASLLALGSEPENAWAATTDDPDADALARVARRSARSGAPLAAAVVELAAERRSAAEDAAAAAAERAGVLISGPLGLCFLPAFVCLGIVPVVMGLAGTVLQGGLL